MGLLVGSRYLYQLTLLIAIVVVCVAQWILATLTSANAFCCLPRYCTMTRSLLIPSLDTIVSILQQTATYMLLTPYYWLDRSGANHRSQKEASR